jgi:AcrR family transcriptional regulator
MLEAAEAILREEGYGALTSRTVAERIGVKQRLVYYYFHTMDDLIVETFRRGANRERETLAEALNSDHPVRKIWDLYAHTADTRLISEFMVLANRIEPLRLEVKSHIEKSRALQVDALTKASKATRSRTTLPPVAAAILATSVTLLLNRELKIGVRTGHAELLSVVNAFIDDADGKPSKRAGKPRGSAPRRIRKKP